MNNHSTTKNDKFIKILLVGAGKLGSRYLEGLLKSNEFLDIDIIEPSEISTKYCKSILSNSRFSNKRLNFKNCLPNSKNNYTLAIVATTADVRVKILEKIHKSYSVDYCILEKLLAQSIDDLDNLKKTVVNFNKTWVNNCMRIMKWHLKMKDIIFTKNKRSIKVILKGKGWGMACNAIHYIDLISWWTDSKIISIDSGQINNWQSSKRIGFQECFGKIKVFLEKGNYLELNCANGESDLIMSIETPKGNWEVNESSGITLDTNLQKITGGLEYQSDITCPLFEKIINTGNCGLTTFEESYFEHQLLLKSLLKSWNIFNKSNDIIIPIT